jgi:hypothetical protein
VPGSALNRRIRSAPSSSPLRAHTAHVTVPERPADWATTRRPPAVARPTRPLLLNSRRSWVRPVQPNPDSRPPQPPHRSHSRVPTERSFSLRRRGAAARSRPGHPHNHGSHHITQDRMEDRTSPTQGTVDALPAAPGQRRRDHAGQDERDPDQLPGPDDALCWKGPFGGHAGGHQGQPSAKPSQIRPLVGEFGLGIGPAPFTHHRHAPLRTSSCQVQPTCRCSDGSISSCLTSPMTGPGGAALPISEGSRLDSSLVGWTLPKCAHHLA